jgi:hypothetical protein
MNMVEIPRSLTAILSAINSSRLLITDQRLRATVIASKWRNPKDWLCPQGMGKQLQALQCFSCSNLNRSLEESSQILSNRPSMVLGSSVLSSDPVHSDSAAPGFQL